MYHKFICLTLLFCLLAGSATAIEIAVAEDLVIDIELSPGWVLFLEPPQALVEAMAKHIAHDPAAADATAEQIKRVARKRLSANEAIIYHAASGAHLDVDFSALTPGEAVPDVRMLRQSAQFAAASLQAEEDITALEWNLSPADITGMAEAVLLTADYLRDGAPVAFLGCLGYTDQYWVFLYGSVPGAAPEILQDLQKMLNQASIRSVGR